jgi:hypothetical protein
VGLIGIGSGVVVVATGNGVFSSSFAQRFLDEMSAPFDGPSRTRAERHHLGLNQKPPKFAVILYFPFRGRRHHNPKPIGRVSAVRP